MEYFILLSTMDQEQESLNHLIRRYWMNGQLELAMHYSSEYVLLCSFYHFRFPSIQTVKALIVIFSYYSLVSDTLRFLFFTNRISKLEILLFLEGEFKSRKSKILYPPIITFIPQYVSSNSYVLVGVRFR